MAELRDFQKGQVVEAHPACDCWMQGDRRGVVSTVGRKFVTVRMTVSGKVRRFTPDLLLPTDPYTGRRIF